MTRHAWVILLSERMEQEVLKFTLYDSHVIPIVKKNKVSVHAAC